MGTGNYRHRDGRTVILNPDENLELVDGDFDEQELIDAQEDVEALVYLATTKTMYPPVYQPSWRAFSNNERICASNDLFQVWFVTDSYGHLFVTYGLRENIHPDQEGMARARLDRNAQAFFDRLQDLLEENGHTISVADTAWTSKPRMSRKERVAASKPAPQPELEDA